MSKEKCSLIGYRLLGILGLLVIVAIHLTCTVFIWQLVVVAIDYFKLGEPTMPVGYVLTRGMLISLTTLLDLVASTLNPIISLPD